MYYAVWKGKIPGIYETWSECQAQVTNFKGALFKKLTSNNLEDAKIEYSKGFVSTGSAKIHSGTRPLENFLTVDGACNGTAKGGLCEYQGVMFPSKEVVFRSKVYENGTNNIAEFLGLVEGIKWFVNKNSFSPTPVRIYTDSVTAMAWVRNKKANVSSKSAQQNEELNKLIEEAENYLKSDVVTQLPDIQILKWNTAEWGEIPADFGRK